MKRPGRNQQHKHHPKKVTEFLVAGLIQKVQQAPEQVLNLFSLVKP
jgi:hypothetical protein